MFNLDYHLFKTFVAWVHRLENETPRLTSLFCVDRGKAQSCVHDLVVLRDFQVLLIDVLWCFGFVTVFLANDFIGAGEDINGRCHSSGSMGTIQIERTPSDGKTTVLGLQLCGGFLTNIISLLALCIDIKDPLWHHG